MQMILITVLINVAAIAVWSVISGENGFAEAAKMLRGQPAFIRSGKSSSKGKVGKEVGEGATDEAKPKPGGGTSGGGGAVKI